MAGSCEGNPRNLSDALQPHAGSQVQVPAPAAVSTQCIYERDAAGFVSQLFESQFSVSEVTASANPSRKPTRTNPHP